MAGQSPDRRRVLEMLAAAAVASQFPGFSRWVFAAEHDHKSVPSDAPRPANYQPQFFTAPEYRTIELLTDLIIPADDTPGAKEAGVSEFIDFMAAHGERELRENLRAGLRWLDGASQTAGGHAFTELTAAQQLDLLKRVAYHDNSGQPDAQGQAFFRLIRRYTVMGYYTSRIGLEELSYPGLQFYSQSPACPHKDDPEHLHLPPSKV
jgi:gluconate 2-dehydrogenase gamma chain